MARCSSSSATGAGSTRAVLMLMLLLGAVVAAHGRSVSCENKCPKPIVVNGFPIAVNAVVVVEVSANGLLKLVVVDVHGKPVGGEYYCPGDVTAVVVVYESLLVKLKVKVGGLLGTVVGLVLGFFRCKLY